MKEFTHFQKIWFDLKNSYFQIGVKLPSSIPHKCVAQIQGTGLEVYILSKTRRYT